MPTYDRKCATCETTFEVVCKISEKDLPMHYCPECGQSEGTWLISAPALAEHQRLSTAKKDSGFKEVLQKIAERNPRTNVTKQV